MIYKSVEICLIPLGTDFFNRKGRKDLRKVRKENKSSIFRNGSTL